MENVKDSIYKFDVLRGIAIILVFIIHSLYAFFPDFDIDYGRYTAITAGEKKINLFFAFSPLGHGWTGVELFLIISGFLIHYSYLKKGAKLNYLIFMIKRFFRIYPPYIIVLLFFLFCYYNSLTTKGNIISHIFLVHNLFEKYFFGINGAFWSLALEFQLYIIYPLFLWLREKVGIKATIWILFIFHISFSLIIFFFLDNKNVYVTFVLRNWIVWGAGALLAEYYFSGKRLSNFSIPAIFVVAIIYLSSRYFTFFTYSSIITVTFLYIIIVEKYLYSNNEINIFEKLLIPVGLTSYSFYLIHNAFIFNIGLGLNLFGLAYKSATLFWAVGSLMVFIIYFLISYSMHKIIELRSIYFGERIIKKLNLK